MVTDIQCYTNDTKQIFKGKTQLSWVFNITIMKSELYNSCNQIADLI